MSYPFSIIGTFIFIAYVAVVLVVVMLPLWLWLLKDRVWKWWSIAPITTLLIAAPVAEELWIAHRFETLCQDAGVHVTRKVEADGYLDATGTSVSSKSIKEGRVREKLSDFEKQGYRYKETLLADKKIMHLERRDGWMQVSIQDKATAQYYYTQPHQDTKVDYRIYKWEWSITDSISHELIARDTHFHRYPGWIEGLWIKYIGSGQEICEGTAPTPPMKRHLLYQYVFTQKN